MSETPAGPPPMVKKRDDVVPGIVPDEPPVIGQPMGPATADEG